jgi:hypothetical protein
MKLRMTHLVGAMLVASVVQAAPITLALSPSDQVVVPGLVSFDVNIAGLGAGGAPTVGSFDLTLAFDAALLLPASVSFGNLLGNPALLEALTDQIFLPGAIEFAEVSLLPPATLDALQPVSFRLATLTFQTLSPGTGSLNFSAITIDDNFGVKLPVTPTGGNITVIPEPASVGMLLVGLLLASGAIRRKRYRGILSGKDFARTMLKKGKSE